VFRAPLSALFRKKPEKGREAAAPSNIKEIQEIQGGPVPCSELMISSPIMVQYEMHDIMLLNIL
jgi:hypothetical protein